MSSPYLSLDIGMHRTGVGLSESGHLAQPLTTVAWKAPHLKPMLEEIVALCRKHDVRTVIVGMPLGADGSTTSQALKTGQCVQQLTELLASDGQTPEIVTVNEFHSTQDAQQRFPDVDKDAAAAALILQDYLDEQGGAW